jgi:outer membrane lipoprotein-sorting protein
MLYTLIIGCTSNKSILPQPEQIGYRELLQYNHVWQEAINNLSGQARITLDSPQYSGNFDAEIILGGQDSLMLSVSGPLGIDVGRVFVSRNRFIFYNQINNQFFTGTKEDFEGRNFMQFPLEINQLRSVFVAQDKFDVLKKDIFEKRDDQYYLEAENAHHNYKIWFDADLLMIRRVEYYANSQLLYYKEYDRFHLVNGIYFPISINFVRPDEKQGVSIYFNTLAINEAIDENDFKIKISDSARQIDLSLEN